MGNVTDEKRTILVEGKKRYRRETVIPGMKLNSTLMALLAVGSCSAAFANDAIDPGESDSTFIIGGGSGSYTNAYEGENSDSFAHFGIRYNGDKFFIKDNSLNYHIGSSNGFSNGITLRGKSSFLSDDDSYDDNANLIGIEERDSTVSLGFYLYHTSDLGRAKLTVTDEISGEHDGQYVDLKYIFDFSFGKFSVNPVIGVEMLSRGEVNHFYGVSESEATLTRAAYKGSSAVNLYAGVTGRYDITPNWDIEAVAGVQRLAREISDSSIVEEDTQSLVKVGVHYNF